MNKSLSDNSQKSYKEPCAKFHFGRFSSAFVILKKNEEVMLTT